MISEKPKYNLGTRKVRSNHSRRNCHLYVTCPWTSTQVVFR